MEEEQYADRIQHNVGYLNAYVMGEGNATVNVTLPPPKKQWLQPARLTLSKPFVGRQGLVDTLIQDLTKGQNVIITGMPGIGKTYLAVKLARDLYVSFPGGAILIEVGPKVTDKDSARIPLRELAKFAIEKIPPSDQFQPEYIAARLNEIAPGRFLVIFDDVWDPTHLRFLSRALPPHAVLLVTTRFAHVAQAIGATVFPLDNLSLDDGLALLEERLGCQNDTTHRQQLEDLVKLLGYHALALEIAAALIGRLPRLETVYLELEQGIRRGALTSLLLPGDLNLNLEVSFMLSYKQLTPEQQRQFRLLGVFAEESMITADAAAALWSKDYDKNAVQRMLRELADLALLDEIEVTAMGSTTFRQHGLLRVFAHDLLEKDNELHKISCIHAQYYTNLSWKVKTRTPGSLTLLDQQTPNLLAALEWTESNDLTLFVRLVSALSDFLLLRGQIALLERYLPKAVTAATDTGDKLLEANLLKSLGDVESRVGKPEQARRHYDVSLQIYEAERNRLGLGEAHILKSRGDLESILSNLEQARRDYDAALPLYEAGRDHLGQVHVLKGLGDLESRLGNPNEARRHYDAALKLYRDERDHLGEANVLKSRGDLESRLGNLDEARCLYDTALTLYRDERNRFGEAHVLKSLGDLESRLGKLEQARHNYDTALQNSKDEHDHLGEADVRKGLGDLESRAGNLDEARSHYDAALLLYQDVPDRLGEANVRRSLGDLESRLGNLEQARHNYDAALPLSQEVRARWCQANVLKSLGDLESRLGNLEQARSLYDAALPFSRDEGDRWGEANVLKSLGDLESRLGNLDEARSLYDTALTLYQAERNHLGEANALKGLGDLESRLGNLEQVRSLYDAALTLYQDERDHLGEANVLKSRGDLESILSNLNEARHDYDAALRLYRADKRDRWGEANVLKSLGDLESHLGNLEQARSLYNAALPLSREVHDRLGEANVLKSRGDLESRLGNLEQARSLYDAALTLYQEVHDRLGEASVLKGLGDLESR